MMNYFLFSGLLLSLPLLAAAGPAAAIAAEKNSPKGAPPFPLAQAQVVKSFASLSDLAEKMKSTACLSPRAASHLKKLASGLRESQEGFQAESSGYLAFVAKAMPGNGECNGGFESVAQESGRRAERASAGAKKIEELQGSLDSEFQREYQKAEWGIDGTKDLRCVALAVRQESAFSRGYEALKAAFGQSKKSLLAEAGRFAAYQAKNEKLAASCGSQGAHANLPARAQEKAVSKAHAPKNSRRSQSQVTGIQKAIQDDNAAKPVISR